MFFILVTTCNSPSFFNAENAEGEALLQAPAGTSSVGPAVEVGESDSQMQAYRARLVELLHPGETVLDALRRLALNGSPEHSQVCSLSAMIPV